MYPPIRSHLGCQERLDGATKDIAKRSACPVSDPMELLFTSGLILRGGPLR
jgi:hypothetical protein